MASLEALERLKQQVDSLVAKEKKELSSRQKQLTLSRFQSLKGIPSDEFDLHPDHAGFLAEFESRVVRGRGKITSADFAKMLVYHKYHYGSARPVVKKR